MNCSERITTYSHEYSNICQVCLGKTELGSFQEENLMKLFLNITNIDVSKNKCPCKICKNCLNELIGISVFIEVAHSNEATLKQGSTDNADNICRVCLSGSNLVPFGNDLLFPLLQSISDSKICCNINFPSNICTKCKQKLKQISDFIELSKKNQSSLEQSYFNKNIKTESCEMEASKNIEDETNNENRNGVSSEGNISSFEKSTLPDRIDLETIKKEQDLDVQATANVKGVKIETDKNSARDHRSEGHTVFSDEIKLESPEIEDIDMENGLIFTCNSCKKDFSSYREGNDYIGEYPAPCNSCGKWFVEKQEIPNSDDEIHIKQEHAFVDEDSKCDFQNERSKEEIKCNVCSEVFSEKSYLTLHMKKHKKKNREPPFQCEICFKNLELYSSMKNHMKKHTGETTFQCEYCSKGFYRKYDLEFHLTKHTKEKPFQCGVCSKFFSNKAYLKVHMGVHAPNKPFQCKICSKSVSSSSSLRYHMKIHEGLKPFTCQICSKSFNIKRTLQVHMRIHTGDNLSQCEVCHKVFTQETQLKGHMRMHTGEKPFQCKVCLKSFPLRGTLNVHMRIHSEEKPFKCQVCSKEFCQKSELKTHTRSHTGEKPFQCEVCSKNFSQNAHLASHMRVHRSHTDEEPFQCEVCAETFFHNSYLASHMRLHRVLNTEQPS